MDAYERGKRAGRLEGYEMAVVAYLLTMQNMFELEADDLYKLSMNVNLELGTHAESFAMRRENEIDSR